MDSSHHKTGENRGKQFKFVPTQPVNPPKLSRVSNRALTQISQLLGLQQKMKKVEEETCYPWQINCDWTPPGLKRPKK